MCVLALALVAAQIPNPSPSDIQRIEDAVKATLRDPDSAKLNFSGGFVSGVYRSLYGTKYAGRITCGTVNAKNGYGGYTGPFAVAAIISDGGIKLESDDDFSDTVNHGYVARRCSELGVPAS